MGSQQTKFQLTYFFLKYDKVVLRFAERLKARLAHTKKCLEKQLHYLPAFQILPEDSPDYQKFARKLRALEIQRDCLERLILK